MIGLGVRPEHITLETGITSKVDVTELMGYYFHMHVTSICCDVVMLVSTLNMTGAEIAAQANGNPIKYTFPRHVCHVFNKETGITLEA